MSDTKEYSFSTDSLIKELPDFAGRGITELVLHDPALAADKKKILLLIDQIKKNAPELFVTIPVEVKNIDQNLVDKTMEIFCSLEIPFEGTEKNGSLLFDKKLYSSKAHLLNEAGSVFGFSLGYGKQAGDTFKLFRERVDFAVSLYPNHMDFPQLEEEIWDPSPTGIYSSKDLDFSHGIAFAARTFYSAGRAVPWFNSVIQALKVNPSTFFADFEEWQQCNNCSLESGFVPEDADPMEIQKMQLLFLQQKFEEKNKTHLLPAVFDVVKLNGAFARLTAENQESTVETSYNPDDLLSPYSMDLVRFVENVPMESCTVKIFEADGMPDYRIL